MRSNDWQPMHNAPLNPYGERYGPTILVWLKADGNPWPAYYDPRHQWAGRDAGPAWIVPDDSDEPPIAPEDAGGWMPIAAPWPEEADQP